MKRHIDKFVSYLEIEKNASNHTILNYSKDLREFSDFLVDVPVEKVNYLSLRKFLAHLKSKNLRPRTLARKISTLTVNSNCSMCEPGLAPDRFL